MFWLMGILMFILVFVIWIMTAVLEMKIDSRIPEAVLTWKTIGEARIWYEQKWLIQFRIFFVSKTLAIADLRKRPSGSKKESGGKKKARRIKNLPGRAISLIRSFDVSEWTIAMDVGDHARNARLYFLNFAPHTRGHLFVNFSDQNYLVIRIRNRPWKIVHAFFRPIII